jgi:uncharacterized membrane protein YbhN (UPF0104 family)
VDIALAIILGVAGGALGALPFLVARRRMKAKMKTDGVGGITNGLVATLVSFALMVLLLAICYLIAKDYLLPFAISTIVVFIFAMVLYTATLMRR